MTEITDYGLDPEVLAFIERTSAHYPEDAATLDAAGQRRVYDAMCAAFDMPIPDGLDIRDGLVPGAGGLADIPVRHYRPAEAQPDTLILYMHGGGFVVGGLHSHHSVCAEICAAAACDLVSVDYRLAPEFTHPAQFDDCLAAFRFFAATYSRIIVAGDSAGANLSAALCMATLKDENKPVGAVLIYPALGGDQFDLPSYTEMANAPMLTTEDMHLYHRLWHGGPQIKGDVFSAPLCATDFDGHPPTAIFSAAIDPLCDDGAAYAQQLNAAGVEVACHTEDGLVHGYLRARAMSRKAAASFTRICAAAKALVDGADMPPTAA